MKSIIGVGVILALAGIAVLARGQSTARPGEPTLARVWVENRAPNEAVPVVVESLPAPLTVRLDSQTAIRTVAMMQTWEYRTVQLTGAVNGGQLNAVGSDGWEAVGVLRADAGSTTILFKRPR